LAECVQEKVLPFQERGIGDLIFCARKILRFVALLTAVPVFLFPAACHQPQTPVDRWQERMLNAHGGRDALKRVTNLVFIGSINTRGDTGAVSLILTDDGELRTSMQYSKHFEDRILQRSRGWRDFGFGFEEVAGPSLAAMIFQYNHLFLPMGLLNGRFSITFKEMMSGDKTFPLLELSDGSGPPMAVMLDSESGLIHQVNGRITVGNQEVIMGVGYRDYRKVNGVMLPHRIINYVNNNVVAESSYDSVAVNRVLAPYLFTVARQPAVP
jgi:hypothetical protein